MWDPNLRLPWAAEIQSILSPKTPPPIVVCYNISGVFDSRGGWGVGGGLFLGGEDGGYF